MLVSFDKAVKQHLEILDSFDGDVIKEFCRIAINFLNKGGKVGEKSYQSAAGKLGVDSEIVRNAIESLCYVFQSAAGHNLERTDFVDSVMTAGLSQTSASILEQFFLENLTILRSVLDETANNLGLVSSFPVYRDLEWRVQVQIGSRSLRHQFIPSVLCKLKTSRPGGTTSTNDETSEEPSDGTEMTQTHLIQMSPQDLVHITQTLDEALQALRSSHCRRIMRNIT